jgi:hypothetical protein
MSVGETAWTYWVSVTGDHWRPAARLSRILKKASTSNPSPAVRH